jgi:cell division protein ZapE
MDAATPESPLLHLGPLPAYRARIAAGHLEPDPSQRAAAERLQDLWVKLRGYDPPPREEEGRGRLLSRFLRRRETEGADEARPNGLYLVGDVGRGKSMLMDLFFAAADVPRKRREHFHRFMQDAHARVHAWRGSHPDGADPIPPLADAVAAEAALLCFDEFQINDIADAMILGRLFQALFARGVVVVATSNTPPDALFAGQPGRDAFLPFIALIKANMDVLFLDGTRDYRRSKLRAGQTWHVPDDAAAGRALDAAFADLTGGAVAHPLRLRVMGRTVDLPLAAEGVGRADFAALCERPLGPGDFLAIATHCHALVVDHVPRLGPASFDAARRFITLIDALYDHRVKLVASAAARPDELYEEGEGAQAFRRTASRLEEMRSDEYLALPHLP